MLELTFGEQVKVVLKRKGMTIKELAEQIEEQTGKKMSRQNLTQRLSRDNFQEQDMRMIAGILSCPFKLDILGESGAAAPVKKEAAPAEMTEVQELPQTEELPQAVEQMQTEETMQPEEEIPRTDIRQETEISGEKERDITVGELVKINEELDAIEAREAALEEPEEMPEEAPAVEEEPEEITEEIPEEEPEEIAEEAPAEEPVKNEPKVRGWRAYLQKHRKNAEAKAEERRKNEEKKLARKAESAENSMTEEAVPDTYEPEAYMEEAYAEEAYEPEVYETEAYETEAYEPQEYEEAYVEEMYADDTDSLGIPEDNEAGDINPYTGREYESNSVRMHPTRIGYVQVYDRVDHQWTDMTEWAFLGYQERKKALLGNDYEEPIYLD